MIRDIKYIVHSMVNKLKTVRHHSEVVSTARLLSKIRKNIDEVACEMSLSTVPSEHNFRKSEVEKQKQFQLTLVTQIQDLRPIFQIIKLELQQHVDTPTLYEKAPQQAMLLTVGKIVNYIRKQLSNVQITLPPFQLDAPGTNTLNLSNLTTPEGMTKILNLTKTLIGALSECDSILENLSNKLTKEAIFSAVDIAIQLRNIRIALSIVKGKKRKMATPDVRLSLAGPTNDQSSFNLRSPKIVTFKATPSTISDGTLPQTPAPRESVAAPTINLQQNKELEELRSLYAKEVQSRKNLELEIAQLKKRNAELEHELDGSRKSVVITKKYQTELVNEIEKLRADKDKEKSQIWPQSYVANDAEKNTSTKTEIL